MSSDMRCGNNYILLRSSTTLGRRGADTGDLVDTFDLEVRQGQQCCLAMDRWELPSIDLQACHIIIIIITSERVT